MIKHTDADVKVNLRGLDLNSHNGQEILYSRLEKAAKKICGPSSMHQAGSLARALANKSCFKETLSRAVGSVGNESLNEIHRSS